MPGLFRSTKVPPVPGGDLRSRGASGLLGELSRRDDCPHSCSNPLRTCNALLSRSRASRLCTKAMKLSSAVLPLLTRSHASRPCRKAMKLSSARWAGAAYLMSLTCDATVAMIVWQALLFKTRQYEEGETLTVDNKSNCQRACGAASMSRFISTPFSMIRKIRSALLYVATKDGLKGLRSGYP